MSYCVAHQMPTGPRGCPQCLREEAVARSLESGRFWRWAALVFGGIVLLAGLTVLITPKPQPRATVLDPERFRAAIEKTESVLYGTSGRLGAGDVIELKDGLREFQTILLRLRPSATQRRAREEYLMFCTMTPAEADHESFDVVATRRRWEELRRAHFRAAPWFRSSTPALEQAQTSATARGIPADAQKYQAVIDELRLLNARVEAHLAPAPLDRDQVDYDGRNVLESARADLRRDVERVRQQMPAQFVGMEPRWRRANTELESALRAVAGGLSSTRRPSGRAAIDQAQASLDAAPR